MSYSELVENLKEKHAEQMEVVREGLISLIVKEQIENQAMAKEHMEKKTITEMYDNILEMYMFGEIKELQARLNRHISKQLVPGAVMRINMWMICVRWMRNAHYNWIKRGTGNYVCTLTVTDKDHVWVATGEGEVQKILKEIVAQKVLDQMIKDNISL